MEDSKAMYGARDAAQNWESAYAEFIESIGFTRGKASSCVFWHKDRELRVVVHGDDFTILGWEKELDWFKAQVAKGFDYKHRGRIGPGEKDEKSIRILNRVVEWREDAR